MIAHKIDLFTDQEMVTASAVPRVIPPRTVSLTLPELAIALLVFMKVDEVKVQLFTDFLKRCRSQGRIPHQSLLVILVHQVAAHMEPECNL